MRLATEIVESLVEGLYSFIEDSRNSGRHDGGLESVQSKKLFSIDWENRMKFWRAVFEKSVLTIFVLLWRYILVQNWFKLVMLPSEPISLNQGGTMAD